MSSRKRRQPLALVFLMGLLPALFAAQTIPPSQLTPKRIRYSVSLAGYRSHLVRVQMQLPPGDASQQIQLPVWNALYQVRDFAQYVHWVKAKSPSGAALALTKIDKTTWRIEGAQDGAVVEYEVFADDPGPYGAQVNEGHAFFNLAEVLMYPVGGRALPTELMFSQLPAPWRIATSLVPDEGGFEAKDYDSLVDAPVEMGTFEESDFDEGGGHYRVVVDAEKADYNLGRIVADVRKIVAAGTGWMNDRPFQTYLFLYHFPRHKGGGGMEHAYSTAIDLNAESLKDSLLILDDVTAHEFFHLWNVKRLRPQSLDPVDYTKENYTRALWFSEGVTSTVSDVFLLRAGLIDERDHLQRLAGQIGELENSPAHRTQSAEESSLDAWLEKYSYYRQSRRSISYYNKGELLGVTLDLALRETSQRGACLRDLFQWMNRNFAQQDKPFPDSAGVEQAAEAVGHTDFADFFRKYVSGTEDIPWDQFFLTVGLHVGRKTTSSPEIGFAAARQPDALPVVTRVLAASEAENAGLAVGDVLLEINGHVVSSDFERQLQGLRSGDPLKLRIRSAHGERELHWKVGTREEVEFVLQDVENMSAQQKARRAAWLRGECQPAGDTRP
jgi:predicted metalloprotease with PDZ domain